MSGPPPKPAHLRQRTNKKSTNAVLPPKDASTTGDAPEIPNPDARTWHPLTLQSWRKAWGSEMASQWLDSDLDVLGRLAILWDEFYKKPHPKTLSEIRLQEQRFGLSPLDRSRLQWEVNRVEGAEEKKRREKPNARPRPDPRAALMAVS